ncbi:MAG: ABC transporter permease [Chloroflexi bacterium]|nr:ABC transporter permease [Chloroflexota bacterium]
MSSYVTRRLALAVPTLLGATLLAFVMLRVLPGDVAELILRGEEGSGAALATPVEQLRRELGLDRPLWEQYGTWLRDMLTGDFGRSLVSGRSIGQELLHRLPVTASLAVLAVLLSTAVGVPLGLFSAVRQDTWVDYLVRSWAVFFLGVPTFWLGLLVLLVGVRQFGWIPPLGYYTPWSDMARSLEQLVFPAAILASHQAALLARMTRSSMLEVLREDYLRTARAKGLPEGTVLVRHALSNALVPVSTMVFLNAGTLFAGAVVLEAVFSIPGLGSLYVEALRWRDYTVIQAYVFFVATVFVLVNLLSDLVYGLLDPRIRHA